MGKKKEDLQEEKNLQQEAAAAEEQQVLEQEAQEQEAKEEQESAEVPESAEAPEAEQEAQEAVKAEKETSLIVLAYPGTEQLMKRIWEKHFQGTVNVLSFPEEEVSLKELLEDVMVSPEFGDTVVIVPANLTPVTTVTINDLMVARVDIDKDQKRFWGRVPVTFKKGDLVDFLPENEELSEEEFVKKYLKENGVRPIEVAHSFGNFYSKVLRGNPCENSVIEAIVRKRFIYANQAGWNAITGLLEKTLAE